MGTGRCDLENAAFHYSGNDDQNYRKGVRVVVTKRLLRSVIEFVPYSDRTALLKLRAKPTELNIIQVCAPTASANQDVTQFNSEVNELLKLTQKHDVIVIMGDFNSKLRRGNFEKLVGRMLSPYGPNQKREG